MFVNTFMHCIDIKFKIGDISVITHYRNSKPNFKKIK